MKIAILSPFEEPVPPKKYGGTELVVYNLTEQLVRMGHSVTLLGTGDSKTSAKLEAIFPISIRGIKDLKTRESFKYLGIGKIVEYLNRNRFDIIHNHIGWRMLAFGKFFKSPAVTTLHSPLDLPCQKVILESYPESNYISISHSQRKLMPDLNYVANVYNGIEIDKFKYFPKPKKYFVFLGRMSPMKGPVEAIKLARKTKSKLVMAAKIDSEDREFYEKKVKPLIDGKQIKYIGEVDHREKVKILGFAKALIAPIQWDEPFGLYFVEAMVCGTPVVAMKRGSAQEIILNKETGFVCASLNEMAERMKKIDLIDRKRCRDFVLRNFTAEKMAENYIQAYLKVSDKLSI